MSDERLRALERRWQETGSMGDGVAYLNEGLRVGVLQRGQLALAAHCGNAAARAVLSAAVPLPEPAAALGVWMDDFRRFGRGSCPRAAAAAARSVLACWRTEFPDSDELERAVAAAEACAQDPSRPRGEAAELAASWAAAAALRAQTVPAYLAASAVEAACHVAARSGRKQQAADPDRWLSRCAQQAALATSPDAVRRAVSAALDPLASAPD